MAEITNRAEIIDEVLERLADGQPLKTICADPRMPHRFTIYRWMQGSDDLGNRMREAREIGYIFRAERVAEKVEACADPLKARAILAAEQWILGKLSVALADKPVIGVSVNVDDADAYAAVAGLLESAAAGKASGRQRTITVAQSGETGPTDAGGSGMANLAGEVRPRLGQDEGRG